MPDDPPILAPDGQPAKPPAEDPAPRPTLTDREPLSDIQERLRRESQAGLRGGKVRRGRQM